MARHGADLITGGRKARALRPDELSETSEPLAPVIISKTYDGKPFVYHSLSICLERLVVYGIVKSCMLAAAPAQKFSEAIASRQLAAAWP